MPAWILGGAGILSSIIGATGGGSAGPTVSSNQSAPYYYQPTDQPGVDTQLQGTFGEYTNPYSNPYASGFSGAYGSASPYLSSYLSSSQGSPYAGAYQTGATSAQPYYTNAANYGNQVGQGAGQLGLYGTNSLQNLGVALSGGNPQTNQMIAGATAGGDAMQGVGYGAIGDAAGLGGMAAQYAQPLTSYTQSGLQGLTGLAQSTTSGLLPYAQQSAYSLPGMASSYAAPGNAAASSILNTAFDPQSALYNQQYQQNNDATNAALAAAGIATSGTGVGILNQSQQNFNTNWQNQQLGRQTQGLSAYESAAGQNYGMQSSAQQQGLTGLESAASGTFAPYSTAYGQGTSALNSAANTGYGIQSNAATTAQSLGAAGAQDIVSGAAQPYNAYQTNVSNELNNYGQLANAGTAYANLGNTGATMQSTAGGNVLTAAGLPYNTSQTILGNQYTGLSNYLNTSGSGSTTGLNLLGNEQNMVTQQTGPLEQYLGLGQSSASGLNAAQQQGYQNAQQAYGSIGSAIGTAAGLAGYGPSATSYSPYQMYGYGGSGVDSSIYGGGYYIPTSGAGSVSGAYTPYSGAGLDFSS